jgi:hypothetical protein
MGHFCPPGSGSGSIGPKSLRIRIRNIGYKVKYLRGDGMPCDFELQITKSSIHSKVEKGSCYFKEIFSTGTVLLLDLTICSLYTYA